MNECDKIIRMNLLALIVVCGFLALGLAAIIYALGAA